MAVGQVAGRRSRRQGRSVSTRSSETCSATRFDSVQLNLRAREIHKCKNNTRYFIFQNHPNQSSHTWSLFTAGYLLLFHTEQTLTRDAAGGVL